MLPSRPLARRTVVLSAVALVAVAGVVVTADGVPPWPSDDNPHADVPTDDAPLTRIPRRKSPEPAPAVPGRVTPPATPGQLESVDEFVWADITVPDPTRHSVRLHRTALDADGRFRVTLRGSGTHSREGTTVQLIRDGEVVRTGHREYDEQFAIEADPGVYTLAAFGSGGLLVVRVAVHPPQPHEPFALRLAPMSEADAIERLLEPVVVARRPNTRFTIPGLSEVSSAIVDRPRTITPSSGESIFVGQLFRVESDAVRDDDIDLRDDFQISIDDTDGEIDEAPAIDAEAMLISNGTVIGEFVTGDRGEFGFENVPAGRHTLVARDDLGWGLVVGVSTQDASRSATPMPRPVPIPVSIPEEINIDDDVASTEIEQTQLAPLPLGGLRQVGLVPPEDLARVFSQPTATPLGIAGGGFGSGTGGGGVGGGGLGGGFLPGFGGGGGGGGDDDDGGENPASPSTP